MICRVSRFFKERPNRGRSYKDQILIRNRSYKNAYKYTPTCFPLIRYVTGFPASRLSGRFP